MSLLQASGGGLGDDSTTPDPLLGTSALRTLGKVLAKAAGVGFEVGTLIREGKVAILWEVCFVQGT